MTAERRFATEILVENAERAHFPQENAMYMRFPIMKWLPKYSPEDFVADLVAGITVGVTVIPQGLAYATVAGLPPQVILNILISTN